MKLKSIAFTGIIAVVTCVFFSFNEPVAFNDYTNIYFQKVISLDVSLKSLERIIEQADLTDDNSQVAIIKQMEKCRIQMKAIDFWLRYLEPVSYKKLNGPLPVEWETEVFEKYEKPYKREGAGLTLAYLYLMENQVNKDSLLSLLKESRKSLNVFQADTIVKPLESYHHFFLCNRLYLLNLAAIYTTGFECPDPAAIIPELNKMMMDVKQIYAFYMVAYPDFPLKTGYLELYEKTLQFVNSQPDNYEMFDHFTFIKNFINPLFALNQMMIKSYNVGSKSYNDFSLNDQCLSIFDKSLYKGQHEKGAYFLIEDEQLLNEIKQTGKLLFYDPLLSHNNSRSCASCHKPSTYFTDTLITTALLYDKSGRLPRNTPTLINVVYNHLLMLDGRHFTLLNQGTDVTSNPLEMGSSEKEIMEKILSCKEYKTAFKKFLPYLKTEKEITFQQVLSAITLYYTSFSNYYSNMDDAMNEKSELATESILGFNLFMGKAKCGTCHFVPHFNGAKPPYISSEFEVLGIPQDTTYKHLSIDKGRFLINPVPEMLNAFRTESLRNIAKTKPYGHNGIFNTMAEVIDFYNDGGGKGKGLFVKNQTLSSDSLHLTFGEKKAILSFMESLTENIIFESPPLKLPESSKKELNLRIPGGVY